jgi:hypothetical protein
MELLRACCLALLVGCAAAAWTPESFPNPEKDVASCGRRGVRSWVCDPDGVISYQSANVVEGLIKKIVMGEAPFAMDRCGAGLEGYQVSRQRPSPAPHWTPLGCACGCSHPFPLPPPSPPLTHPPTPGRRWRWR